MSIFLSYRRADSADALCIYPWLIQWFGRERVFWDRKDIHPGENFADVLENQIRSSKAFVALLSENWLSATDEQGNRRIDSPEDWIRRETLLALQQEILVIPVLVGGTKCPTAEELPEVLREISQLHMLPTSDITFYDQLRESLEKVMPIEDEDLTATDDTVIRLQRRASSLLRRQIKRLQVRAVELIEDRKLDRATDELTEGSELLMAMLDLLPGDTSLDAQLGYLYGTTGQALLRGGEAAKADAYFDRAMSVFRRVHSNPEVFHERPADLASAIKGIGGVYYERGDHVRAIEFYRRALSIFENYPEAWHDLFAAYHELAKRGTIDIPAMQQAVDKLREIGARLGKDKIETFETLLRSWRERAARSQDRDGETHLAITPEFLTLVIAERDPDLAIFNLNCRIANYGHSTVNVRNLKVAVTAPNVSGAIFEWTLFYEFRPSEGREMKASGEARAFEVPAGETIGMGVQFTDSESCSGHLWTQGEFDFELSALYDDDQTLKTKFGVTLGEKEADDVIALRGADKDFWDRWSDSDRAIGIPARISKCDPT